tara:strand:+ start:573 stop:821 length:249 start_codon:yes stop_codon:yes gene_type:complete
MSLGTDLTGAVEQIRAQLETETLTTGSLLSFLDHVEGLGLRVGDMERQIAPAHLRAPAPPVVCDGVNVISFFARRQAAGEVT